MSWVCIHTVQGSSFNGSLCCSAHFLSGSYVTDNQSSHSWTLKDNLAYGMRKGGWCDDQNKTIARVNVQPPFKTWVFSLLSIHLSMSMGGNFMVSALVSTKVILYFVSASFWNLLLGFVCKRASCFCSVQPALWPQIQTAALAMHFASLHQQHWETKWSL